MTKLDEFLTQKFSWYKNWHEIPATKVLHSVTLIVVLILVVNLCYSKIKIDINQSSASNSAAAGNVLKRQGGHAAQDHILVKFKDNVGQAKKAQVLAKHGLTEQSEIPDIKVKLVNISPNDTPEEVVDRLNAQDKDSVEFAEVDAVTYPDYTPNDPQYGANWQLSKMSAPAAWDVTTGSPSIIIAILDTGTDCTHEDLAPHCVPGWNVYDNNSNTADVHGHGTATAGTAAAVGDNGVGIASPCYNCKIMPIRIANSAGSSTVSYIATAITYAADHGAKVANISFGPLSGVSTISTASKYLMDKGGVVTISAGNSSLNHPNADDPYEIMVSAIDPNDALYSFSDYGTDIDLAAAGCVTSTNNGGGYGGWCGTSFSAPTVAGVAGLVFSQNPSLTGYQVRDILKSNTNDVYSQGYDIYSGFGTPNMLTAVNAAGSTTPTPAPAPAPAPSPTPTPAPVTNVTITSKQVTNKSANSVNISWTTNINSTGTVSFGNSSGSLTSSILDGIISKTHTVTLNNLSNLTTYYYKISATSTDNGSTAVSPVTSFKTSKK